MRKASPERLLNHFVPYDAALTEKMSKMALINPSSDETFHFEVIDFKTISSLLQGCESVCEKEPSEKSEM